MSTLAKDAQEYASLKAQKQAAEASVEELSAKLTKLEAELLQRMGDEGVASLKVDTPEGRFTLFPRRTLWASCVPGHDQELHDGLRALGYGDLVKETVNSQRLSSLVREYDTTGAEIPQEIAGAVKVTERFQLSVRKA